MNSGFSYIFFLMNYRQNTDLSFYLPKMYIVNTNQIQLFRFKHFLAIYMNNELKYFLHQTPKTNVEVNHNHEIIF